MSISHRAARAGAFARVRFPVTWVSMSIAACGLSAAAIAATPSVTIGGTPVTSVLAAKYYSFQPWASDSQHGALKFSIANKPSWAGFDPNYGRLYGTPIPANVGTYGKVVISVSNGNSTAALPGFSIVVQPMNNPGPVISGAPPLTAVVGTAYAFQPSARDDYGLRITFEIYNKPAWLTLNGATGRLSGTPGPQDVGTYARIVESVTDGYKRGTLPAFDLTVSAGTGSGNAWLPAPAPKPPAPPPAPQPVLSSINLQWEPPTENLDSTQLTDLAGYHVYYGTVADELELMISVDNPGVAGYVVENLAPGTWYFGVAAYNSAGYEGELSQVISKLIR